MGEQSQGNGFVHFCKMGLATILSKICASGATYPHEVLRTRMQTQQRSAPSNSPEGIAFRGSLDDPNSRSRLQGGSSSDGMANQPRYRGVVKTFKTILHEEGWRAFYAGIGTNMVRAVPAAMTTILTYETLSGYIKNAREELKAGHGTENGGAVI